MYDLTYDSGHRCLFELDISQLMEKHWEQKEMTAATSHKGPSFISSQPAWQKDCIPDDEKGPLATLEPGTAVLGVCFIRNPEHPSAAQSDVGLQEALFGSQSGVPMK